MAEKASASPNCAFTFLFKREFLFAEKFNEKNAFMLRSLSFPKTEQTSWEPFNLPKEVKQARSCTKEDCSGCFQFMAKSAEGKHIHHNFPALFKLRENLA